MNNVESQISRMKAMMSYGLQTENKNSQYKSVEYQKIAADGKTYGIVREGTKFYIKVADSQKPNLIKEDFDYIGGFRNRKHNEYSSYANALKNFDMKMISLKEAVGNRTMVVESWNPEKNEYLVVEATENMKKEIARQRQIMGNASMIMEGSKSCSCEGCECAKEEKSAEVLPKGKGGDIFTEKPKSDDVEGGINTEKNNIGKAEAPKKGKQATNEAAEPLAWHKEGGDAQETIADTYMDTSHGTEIGSSAPFEKGENDKSELKNGTVEEGKSMAMDCGDNQNTPSVGVGPIGDKAPFDGEKGTQIDEAEEGEDVIDDEPSIDEPVDGEDSFEDDDDIADLDGDGDLDGDDVDISDLDSEDPFEDDEESDLESDDIESLKDEIAQLKDMLSVIMDKVGASSEEEAEVEFDEEPLYDDDEEDSESDFDIELGDDDFEDDDFEDDDTEVFESRSYRRMKSLNEDRLDYFGKHPAYRKEPMQLPTTGEDSNEHGEDWNDESVHTENPYGEKIGSSAPFEISPDTIDNAIAESVKKLFGKK